MGVWWETNQILSFKPYAFRGMLTNYLAFVKQYLEFEWTVQISFEYAMHYDKLNKFTSMR